MLNLVLEKLMIKCENIRIENDKKLILDNVNLHIKKGEKILLKGESGSGKTSLIRAIIYFTEFLGEIIYEGKRIGIENINKYRNNIGYIGQKIPNFNQSVGEFLSIHKDFKFNKNLKLNDKKKFELLERLNFNESILNSKFNVLSGGERQRIAVIGVLLLNKPFYIFDEITSALDKKNINSLISLIMEDEERTVISVSHNIEWEKYSTRIIKMENGAIIEDRNI